MKPEHPLKETEKYKHQRKHERSVYAKQENKSQNNPI
jgi:hypothetical protein